MDLRSELPPRTRRTIMAAARLVGLDAALVGIWHWNRHASWGAIVPWALGLVALSSCIVAYTWWYRSDRL